MSVYIKLSTLEFPKYEGDIRLEHPEILESQTGETFPCPATYAPVEVIGFLEFDTKTTFAEVSRPYKRENGMWRARWQFRTLTDEELAWNAAYEVEWAKQNGVVL